MKQENRTGKFLKCAYCGKEVYTPPWRLKFKTRFCSREHQLALSKENAYHLDCVVCGKMFYCQPCQVVLRKRKTCSRKCQGVLASTLAEKERLLRGMTKHQIDRCIRYSKRAERWRKSVFERDDYTCTSCGERGGYLEAHHLKPFAYFPGERFKISNGVTLCKKCHNKTKMDSKKMRLIYLDEVK